MNFELVKTCVILPKAQPGANSYRLHISYFLQKCKKGKSCEMDLPLLESDIPTNLESGQTTCSYHKKEIGKPSKKDLLKNG